MEEEGSGDGVIWSSPEYFFLLLPLSVLVAWNWLGRRKKLSALQFSSIASLKNLQPGWRKRLEWLPKASIVASLALVVVALARPQTTDTQVKKNIDGIDIVICLDVSDSMLIEDMKPSNRIEAAKETIYKFVEKRTSDRIGLVVFAGEAFTQVPLTLDYELILSRVKEITTAQEARIKDGTALGVALANAAGRLKDSTAKSKVMIFLTDGENNSGTIDPATGLEIAKGYGIKIYSIGIGRDGPTRIPVFARDAFGNRIKTYQPFESTVNEDLLNRLADETGGKFYRATAEDSLKSVFADIDKLEKTQIDINKFTRYKEHFPFYLWIALGLYGFAWLMQVTVLRRMP